MTKFSAKSFLYPFNFFKNMWQLHLTPESCCKIFYIALKTRSIVQDSSTHEEQGEKAKFCFLKFRSLPTATKLSL